MRKIAPALRRSIFHGYYLWEQKCLDLQKKKSAVLHLRNGRFYMNILRFIITSALNNAYSKNQKQKVFIINLLTNGFKCNINNYQNYFLSVDILKKLLYNIFRRVIDMPNILSSTALRNGYNDVSSFCHLENKPVFITRNGQGDLAVMSMEHYEEMLDKIELYEKIYAGISDFENGDFEPYEEVRKEILNV